MSALSGRWGSLERTLLTLTVSGLISSRQVQRSFLKSSWNLSLCLVRHLSWLLPAQRSDYCCPGCDLHFGLLAVSRFPPFCRGGWRPRLLKALGLPGQKQRLPGTTRHPSARAFVYQSPGSRRLGSGLLQSTGLPGSGGAAMAHYRKRFPKPENVNQGLGVFADKGCVSLSNSTFAALPLTSPGTSAGPAEPLFLGKGWMCLC